MSAVGEMTAADKLRLLELLRAEESAKTPKVGAGETFVSRGVGAVPAGGLVSDLIATGIMQARRAGGLGESDVKPTEEALAEMKARGLELPSSSDGPGLVEEYRQIRDTRRERTDAGSEQNPWAGRAGAGVGMLATALAPLPKFAPRATQATAALPKALQQTTAGSRMLAGTGTGAGYGALSGLTDGRADLTRGEVGSAAAETLGGGLLGAGLGGAASGLAEIARPLAQAVQKFGVERGRKLLTSGSGQLASNKPVPEEAVLEAYRVGAIPLLGSATKAQAKLEPITERVGELYGEILSGLEAKGVAGPNAIRMADDLLERAIKAETGKDPKIVKAYMDAASDLTKRARLAESRGIAPKDKLGLKQAEELKRTYQAQAKYDKIKSTPTDLTKKEIAALIREANEGAVEEAGKAGGEVGDLAAQFVPVKQRFGRLAQALEAAELGAGREATRTGGGLAGALGKAGSGVAFGPGVAAGEIGLGMLKRGLSSSEANLALRLSDALRRGATGAGASAAASGLTARELKRIQDYLRDTK